MTPAAGSGYQQGQSIKVSPEIYAKFKAKVDDEGQTVRWTIEQMMIAYLKLPKRAAAFTEMELR